jgi:hypothetical protein
MRPIFQATWVVVVRVNSLVVVSNLIKVPGTIISLKVGKSVKFVIIMMLMILRRLQKNAGV